MITIAIENREHWKSVLDERTWSEIFEGLELGFKKDRGGKFVSDGVCFNCGFEGTMVGRPKSTFRCRNCKVIGDKLEYVLQKLDINLFHYEGPTIEDDLKQFLAELPPVEDPRQRRLFPKKRLNLHWK